LKKVGRYSRGENQGLVSESYGLGRNAKPKEQKWKGKMNYSVKWPTLLKERTCSLKGKIEIR